MAVTEAFTTGTVPSTKVQRGSHQAYHVLPFSVDRTNLFVGKIEYHVFELWNDPDASLLSLDYGTRTVGADAGMSSMASGTALGPTCVGVERRYDEANSMAIYTYTFEGIAFNHFQKYIEYELEFTMEQTPIETHPHFQTLNDTFGPYDSLNRLWPPIVTETSFNAGLPGGGSGTGPITNPMYGVTSYLVPGCVYRVTYTNPDTGKNFIGSLGMISTPDETPPAPFSNFSSIITSPGGSRNWLKMAPKIRQHGSCITITEEWLLSGPRGWIDIMYGPEAFK